MPYVVGLCGVNTRIWHFTDLNVKTIDGNLEAGARILRHYLDRSKENYLQLFKDKDLQLLMFDKRIKFVKPNGAVENKITFSSSYYCYNFLPKQIIMEFLQ